MFLLVAFGNLVDQLGSMPWDQSTAPLTLTPRRRRESARRSEDRVREPPAGNDRLGTSVAAIKVVRRTRRAAVPWVGLLLAHEQGDGEQAQERRHPNSVRREERRDLDTGPSPAVSRVRTGAAKRIPLRLHPVAVGAEVDDVLVDAHGMVNTNSPLAMSLTRIVPEGR